MIRDFQSGLLYMFCLYCIQIIYRYIIKTFISSASVTCNNVRSLQHQSNILKQYKEFKQHPQFENRSRPLNTCKAKRRWHIRFFTPHGFKNFIKRIIPISQTEFSFLKIWRKYKKVRPHRSFIFQKKPEKQKINLFWPTIPVH